MKKRNESGQKRVFIWKSNWEGHRDIFKGNRVRTENSRENCDAQYDERTERIT